MKTLCNDYIILSYLQIKISGSMEHVLEKVRKGKPRQQKATKPKKEEKTPPPTPPPPPPQDDTYVLPTCWLLVINLIMFNYYISDATPTTVESPKRSAGPESTPGARDSAGDQSGDSKEGKRKGRSKPDKKKKKEAGGVEAGAEDKTPIITHPPSEELA